MLRSKVKRSQIQTQIFVYIIAAVLFSFVLIYGYNAIKDFRGKSEQVAYIKFRTNLVSAIKRVAPDYGTLKREEFFIGGEYTKACFVQSYNVDASRRVTIANHLDDPSAKYGMIADSVGDEVDKNVFLFTSSFQESFDIGPINVTDSKGYVCIDLVRGKARIQLEGKGDHAILSGW